MRILRNKKGEGTVFTAVVIVAISMLISAILFFAYVQIQTIAVRNAMKTSLANLSTSIAEDTYTALREGDFDKYMQKLTESTEYSNMLENRYIDDIKETIPLNTDEYRITDIRLTFEQEGKKIYYVCTCNVAFKINIFGINTEAIVNSVEVRGSHSAKYGR